MQHNKDALTSIGTNRKNKLNLYGHHLLGFTYGKRHSEVNKCIKIEDSVIVDCEMPTEG